MSSLVLPRTGAQLLSRVLDQPELVAAVQGLPAVALGKLVDQVGLEDASELISLATTEQVVQMLDDDVFQEDTFDPERFLLWLEVTLEAGDALCAQRLSELDEDLLALAFHRLMLVVEIVELPAWANGPSGKSFDRIIESSVGEELGSYQLISRRPDGWDTVFTVILALDRDHPELLERILLRCAYLAAEAVAEHDGLFELLSAEDALDVDVRGNRDERRSELGYVSMDDAKAFLNGARRDGALPRDHVTERYLRRQSIARPAPTMSAASMRLLGVLAESGVIEPAAQAPALPSGDEPGASRFAQAMRSLRSQPLLYAARLAEFTYLCNVMMAGEKREGRPLRPIEVVEEVVTACSRGLELDPHGLEELGADHFFKVGWHTRA